MQAKRELEQKEMQAKHEAHVKELQERNDRRMEEILNYERQHRAQIAGVLDGISDHIASSNKTQDGLLRQMENNNSEIKSLADEVRRKG